MPMGTALENLKEMVKDHEPEILLVAEEKHADGTPHLHCVVKTGKKMNIRDKNYWDEVAGKHGNYENIKGRNGLYKVGS